MLVVAGVLAACCAAGATVALLSSALVKDAIPSAGQGGDTGQAGDGDGDGGGGRDGDGGGDGDGGEGDSGPGLDTAVRDGAFEFVVSDVSCGHSSLGGSIINVKAQGQFCVVSLSVANIGTKARTFTDVFQKALDTDGTVYGADTGAGLIANEGGGVMWKVVNPGNKITGKIVYDIPADGHVATLELHDSVLSRGVLVTLS
jgi:hypothetical protein